MAADVTHYYGQLPAPTPLPLPLKFGLLGRKAASFQKALLPEELFTDLVFSLAGQCVDHRVRYHLLISFASLNVLLSAFQLTLLMLFVPCLAKKFRGETCSRTGAKGTFIGTFTGTFACTICYTVV